MIPGILSAPLIASAQAMTAVASPGNLSRVVGTRASGSQTLTTAATTVNVTGGTPPYSHSWSGDARITPSAPTSATTQFSATIFPDHEIDTIMTDTVTDANGIATTATCEVDIYLVNTAP
jgi:hypothetical protein